MQRRRPRRLLSYQHSDLAPPVPSSGNNVDPVPTKAPGEGTTRAATTTSGGPSSDSAGCRSSSPATCQRPARTSAARSRFVHATMRTSTFSTRPEPTGWISPSCSARRSFAWTAAGSSPTSSRTRVPPFASAKNPARAWVAPVKAPRPVDLQQLQVPADDRERRPQLVPGVVEELLLHPERLLQPVEHRVDRPGEGGDVVAPRHGDPQPEVAGGQLLGRRPQPPPELRVVRVDEDLLSRLGVLDVDHADRREFELEAVDDPQREDVVPAGEPGQRRFPPGPGQEVREDDHRAPASGEARQGPEGSCEIGRAARPDARRRHFLGVEQVLEDPQYLGSAVPRRDGPDDRLVEQHRTDPVAAPGEELRDRPRDLGEHHVLAAGGRPEPHGRRGVQHQPGGDLALLDVLAHVRLVGAGGDVPVDVPDVVAGLVLAQVGDVGAVAAGWLYQVDSDRKTMNIMKDGKTVMTGERTSSCLYKLQGSAVAGGVMEDGYAGVAVHDPEGGEPGVGSSGGSA